MELRSVTREVDFGIFSQVDVAAEKRKSRQPSFKGPASIQGLQLFDPAFRQM